jgi:hypothetical protein
MTTTTDLGPSQLTMQLQLTGYAKLGMTQVPPNLSGSFYEVLAYWSVYESNSSIRTNLVTVNLDTGATVAVQGPLGRPYSFNQRPLDNLLYLGVGCSADLAVELGTFNFVTGQYVVRGYSPSQAAYNSGVDKYDSSGSNGVTWSDEPHQRIFYYGGLYGCLWAIDPEDSYSVQNYGPVGFASIAFQRYGNSFQVSDTYAYCEMRDNVGDRCYLVIKSLADGTETYKWKTDNYTLSQLTLNLHRGWIGADTGKIFVNKIVNGVSNEWFDVADLNTPIGRVPDAFPWGPGSRSYIDYTGYSLDAARAVPDGTGNKVVPIWYKNPAHGETYQYTSVTLVDLSPFGLNAMGLDFSDNIVGFSAGSAIAIDSNDVWSYLGSSGINSAYVIGRDWGRGLLFLGGYSQESWEVDTMVAWNPVRISLARQSAGSWNPMDGARYHLGFFKSPNGFWWIPTMIVRSDSQSQLLWYNPDSTLTEDVGWDTLNSYNLENCAMSLSGTKIVFTGVKDSGSILAVINTARKSVSKYLYNAGPGYTVGRIVSVEKDKSTTNQFMSVCNVWYGSITVTAGPKPVTGETMTGLTSEGSAKVWITPSEWTVGQTYTVYFNTPSPNFTAENVTFSGGGTGTISGYLEQKHCVFCIDIRTNATLWGPIFKSGLAKFNAFTTGFGPVFDHELVWYYAGNNIIGVDPTNGDTIKTVAVSNIGAFLWRGLNIYHCDSVDNHIYKITGLLS